MSDREDADLLPVLAGVAVGFGLGRIGLGRGRRIFNRPTGFRMAQEVIIQQLSDGNWDVNPYRAQLPKSNGQSIPVRWALAPGTIAEGYSFDPISGIVFNSGGDDFYNPRRPSSGVFELTARNSTPDLEFKYSINLFRNGQSHFSIDPVYRNGPHN